MKIEQKNHVTNNFSFSLGDFPSAIMLNGQTFKSNLFIIIDKRSLSMLVKV